MFSTTDVPYSTAFTATFNNADVSVPFTVKDAIDASTKIYITRIVVSVDSVPAAFWVKFQDDTTPTVNTLVERIYMGDSQVKELTWDKEAPLIVVANQKFEVLASAAANVTVNIAGFTD